MKKIFSIIVLVVIVAAALWAFWLFKAETPSEKLPETPKNEQNREAAEKEKACVDSGGIVTAALCCQSAEDFPDSCAIGACGCAPEYSHQVKFCGCGDGKCFEKNACVEARGK